MFNQQTLEKKMDSPAFSICINIFLVIIIYIAALLGRSLGISDSPLPLSVVWPATGFALAALLIFGYKTWPGILLGNFIYNIFGLYPESMSDLSSFLAALSVSIGSLAEGLIAYFIMKKYCTPTYFNTVKDVLIFLIPAGLFPSFLAAFIGVTALHLYEPNLTWNQYFHMLVTFSIGDLMGVYVFTPLIVIWTLKEPLVKLRYFTFEVLLMLAGYVIVTVLFVQGVPVVHFYIPLALWVTYRFQMHGATLAIFYVAFATILATSLQYGPIVQRFPVNYLLLLVTFLQVLIVTSFVLAALINEREVAWKQIRSYNINLEESIFQHREELKDKINQIFIKEKLVSVGMLTAGIAQQMQGPLRKIDKSIQTSIDFLKQFEKSLDLRKDKLDEEMFRSLHHQLGTLSYHLSNIRKYEAQAFKIAKVIQEHSIMGTPEKLITRSVDINNLLNNCLIKATAEESKLNPDFIFNTIEKFDNNVLLFLAMPEDLVHAITFLMHNAIHSMQKKKDQENYKPVLELMTKNYSNKIEIMIKDNGNGISQEQLNYIIATNHKPPDLEDVTDFGFTLVHDIILHVYHGEILAELKPGEYEQFILVLPKDSPETLPEEKFA